MAIEIDSALSRSFTRRLIDLLPLFGILAAISYAVLRLAYLQFYYNFMVAPEEVGLGQAELLTQSLVAPLFLLVAIGVAVIVLGFLLFVVGIILRPLARPLSNFGSRLPIIGRFALSRSNNKPHGAIGPSEESTDANGPMIKARSSNETSRSLNVEAGIVTTFIAILFLALLFIQANLAVTGVREGGYTITTVHWPVGPVNIPSLNIIAWPSSVEWKESAKTPSTLKPYPNCIMYLGKANGTTVIYNVKTRMTIRFRSDDAIVVVYPFKTRLAPSCYE